MVMRRLMGVFLLLCLLLGGCSLPCENDCGRRSDPFCSADMCDECCDKWMGLNGCDREHCR